VKVDTIAARICKAGDRSPADARAMLRQVDQDHGREAVLEVIARMRVLSQTRYQEVMRVFEGLPGMSFEEALRIKRERGDPCAQGWMKHEGTYIKIIYRET
jgi:hypothetical protein